MAYQRVVLLKVALVNRTVKDESKWPACNYDNPINVLNLVFTVPPALDAPTYLPKSTVLIFQAHSCTLESCTSQEQGRSTAQADCASLLRPFCR